MTWPPLRRPGTGIPALATCPRCEEIVVAKVEREARSADIARTRSDQKRADRSEQVFGISLRLGHIGSRLHAGMPVEATSAETAK